MALEWTPEMKEFVENHSTSIEQLEVLLFLRSYPDQYFSDERLN